MNTVFLPDHTVPALVGIYAINILMIIAVIFAERKSPSATLAWIMVLAFVPIIGFVFYLVFNQNIARIKINRLTENEKYVVSHALKKQMQEMDNPRYAFHCPTTRNWRHLIKLNQVYGHAFYSENNQVELITDGMTLLDRMMRDIQGAKDTINMEYFIIKKDFVGMSLIELLTQKAKEGVTVRLLLDSMGCRTINEHVLKDYLAAGGKVGFFFKPKFKIFGLKLNYRNHRKIVVIDHKIAYTGGYNIAKEYIGQKKKFGYWRDTHIRLTGDAVADLNGRFILDWRFTTKEQLQLEAARMAEGETPGHIGVQIVSCGPESPSEEVKRAMMRMITFAEKRVYLQTPYFVPDPSIVESLKMAVQSGVDVRIMIPHMPDHVFVYWATYSYVGELLRSGARAYIYDDGFLHAKTLVVDGEVGTIGSTNFDNRSFRLNFETNAFIFDKDFAQQMERAFIHDMAHHGHELTYADYLKRGKLIKFKEAISRLLSDIL